MCGFIVNMLWKPLTALASVAAPAQALIRFSCSQLVIDRVDPLVNPGITPSPHLHQIIGGVRSQTRIHFSFFLSFYVFRSMGMSK